MQSCIKIHWIDQKLEQYVLEAPPPSLYLKIQIFLKLVLDMFSTSKVMQTGNVATCRLVLVQFFFWHLGGGYPIWKWMHDPLNINWYNLAGYHFVWVDVLNISGGSFKKICIFRYNKGGGLPKYILLLTFDLFNGSLCNFAWQLTSQWVIYIINFNTFSSKFFFDILGGGA